MADKDCRIVCGQTSDRKKFIVQLYYVAHFL